MCYSRDKSNLTMPYLRSRKKKKTNFSFKPNPAYHTKRWRDKRNSYIKAHPNCEILENGKVCGMPGYSVDHIKPIRLGGHLTDESNLQTSCRRHQYKKSAQDAAKYKNQYGK